MRLSPKTHIFDNVGPINGGYIHIWEEPQEHHTYSAGFDFAFGLESGDFDAGVILKDTGEQVAEVEGHWGEGFPSIVNPLLDWFQPFIVGEPTATGLPILRGWYDEGRWLYFHRAEQKKARSTRDQLGHVPGASDITVHWLRRELRERDLPVYQRFDAERLRRARVAGLIQPVPAVLPTVTTLPQYRTARHRLVIRGENTYQQACKFRFLPRRGQQGIEDARDDQLAWGAPPGEHDDLLRALAMANAGLEWLPKFEKPSKPLPANSIGKFLEYDKDEEDEGKSRWD
jgi:hypothetical protein